jgi:hypothetical protein
LIFGLAIAGQFVLIRSLDDLSTEDILALCIYRGGPHANLETYVRGNCVYRASETAPRQ